MRKFWKYLLLDFYLLRVVEEGAGAAEEPEDRGDNFTPKDEGAPDEDTPKDEGAPDEGAPKDKDAPDEDAPDEDAPDEDAPDEDDGKGHMIPKSRFDFKSQQARTYKEQVAKLQKQLDEQTKDTGGEVDKASQQAEELEVVLADLAAKQLQAIADNDTEAALKLSEQSRAEERKFYLNALKNDTETTVLSAKDAAVQEMRLDKLLDDVEATYDALNPESEAFDKDLIAEVNDLRDSFEARGYSSVDSLKRAIGYVMPDAPNEAPASKEDPADKSRKPDIQAKLEAAKKNAPDMEDIGKDSNKMGSDGEIDVTKLSEDEFDKLPESTKARIRGDVFG